MKMEIRFFIVISLTVCFVSCMNDNCMDFYDFEYDYKVESYFKYANATDSSLMHVDFYKNGLLIISSDKDGGFRKYLYDEKGILREYYWGRQCGYSLRYINKFDSLDNCIGKIRLSKFDSITNIDTVKFDQVRFYDNKSRLTKELKHSTPGSDGYKYREWEIYTYDGVKINMSIMLENSIVTWKGIYKYDSIGNLIEIDKRYRDYFEITHYKYNDKGLLIEESIMGNKNPIMTETIFSTTNNKIEYQYDSSGFKIAALVYNHKNELQHISIYKKVYSCNNQ